MRAEQAVRICEGCERFEWEWIEGSQPRIEAYLEKAPVEDRDQLLEDLLRIELEWRLGSGEQPLPQEYVTGSPVMET